MSAWEYMPFSAAISDKSSGNLKVPKSDYREAGAYPIVDQGQDPIGGYTDDPKFLQKEQLPVVIFGDHTRHFKYVNFPFCMGADGVKILKPSPGFDERYLFRYLESLKIPNAGYSRHFKFLKEFQVPNPPLVEQERIADVLELVDGLRAKRREAIALLDDLAQSIFLDMFGDPRENPHSWPSVRLSELADSNDRINYGVVQPGDSVENGVPLVRVGDLVDGHVNHSKLKIISVDIERKYTRSRIKGNEILVGCVGSIGAVAVVTQAEVGFNIARAVARIPIESDLRRQYIAEYLRMPSVQDYFLSELRTVAQPTLNIKQLSETVVLTPPAPLQEVFVSSVALVNALRVQYYRHLAELNSLFASLQDRAFRGDLFTERSAAA